MNLDRISQIKSVSLNHLVDESLSQGFQFSQEAAHHYQLLTLRTHTLVADEFYRQLGFKTYPNWEHTTHHRQLSEIDYYPLS